MYIRFMKQWHIGFLAQLVWTTQWLGQCSVYIAPLVPHDIKLEEAWRVVGLSRLESLLYPATPSPCPWTSGTSPSSPHPFRTISSLSSPTHWHILVSPNLVSRCTCIHTIRRTVVRFTYDLVTTVPVTVRHGTCTYTLSDPSAFNIQR
jgi:hypothetical protein